MNIIVTKRFSCNKSNITAGKPTVVFRRCNSKVCNFGLMNEHEDKSGLTWRFHNSFRDHLADGSGLRPRLESLVTFLSSDGDVVTTFTLRRMLTTSARCLLGALQSRQGEVFLGFLGLGVCAGSLWSGKKKTQSGLNYGESFHAYAMSPNISQLKHIYTMNLPEPFLSFVRSGWHVVKLFAALYGHKTPHEHTKAIWTKQNNATVLYSDQLNDSYDYKL